MQDLKSVYDKLQAKKKERKELTKMFQDELKHDSEYQELTRQLKTLRERRKSIETRAKANALQDARQLDALAEDIKGSTELLTDVVIAKFLNRESVELTDEEQNRLVPVFSVRFRKEEGESMVAQVAAARAESHPDRTFSPVSMEKQTA